MRTGFTGTQRGMTPQQKATVARLFEEFKPREFHHGDCIGADADAHKIFRARKEGKVILHPPTNRSKRAFCQADVTLGALAYLDRNKEIVINSDVLLACPGEVEEQLRSGTWSTIRFARKRGHPVFIVFPDGTTDGPVLMSDPMF